MPTYYGGLEAGGTKLVCAVGADPDTLVAQTRIPTTTPAEAPTERPAYSGSRLYISARTPVIMLGFVQT